VIAGASLKKENIMTKGQLTREQAIKQAGLKNVVRLDYENCEYTGRVQTDGDDSVEFSASILFRDDDDLQCTLIAYYYQQDEDLEGVEDLSMLDWEIEGYEIV
jgi:hypothetical protein